ncbi:MAG: hypothetical protein LBF97_06720 [Elusimicrobiota bacterium]|jgi:hypothetical protein|nr:hypothetical protein [Elusimicrobiota bacterium]
MDEEEIVTAEGVEQNNIVYTLNNTAYNYRLISSITDRNGVVVDEPYLNVSTVQNSNFNDDIYVSSDSSNSTARINNTRIFVDGSGDYIINGKFEINSEYINLNHVFARKSSNTKKFKI